MIIHLGHRVLGEHAPDGANAYADALRDINLRVARAQKNLDLVTQQQGDHLPVLPASLAAHLLLHHASDSLLERPDFPEWMRPDFPEPSPDEETIKDEITNAVLNEATEYFTFEDEVQS